MFMIMKNNTSNNSWQQLPEDGIDFAYRPASGQC